MSSKHLSIYSIAFLEGGALLSFEIMVSRIYTPHLGSTIYVWTSILACTLISLALAYRFSHRLIVRSNWKSIPWFLSIAGIFILFATYFSHSLLESTYSMSIRSASLFVGFSIVSIPVFCMGVISPMLASYIAQTTNQLGKETGIIYGISTLSGVFLTLISVFLLLPTIGVKNTLLFQALILFTAAMLSYITFKKQ